MTMADRKFDARTREGKLRLDRKAALRYAIMLMREKGRWREIMEKNNLPLQTLLRWVDEL